VNKKYTPFIIVTMLSLIWSSSWLAIKIGLFNMPPFLSAGYRFFIAFIVLLSYAIQQKISFQSSLKGHIFYIGFSFINFTSGYALVYWGEQYINSGLTSVLFSVMPFYVALLSIKMLTQEKITPKKIAGITIGFIGVIIIFHDQLQISHPLALYGMFGVLISPGFSALGTIIGKKVVQKYHPVNLNTYPLLYSSLTFFIMHFVFEPGAPVNYNFPAIASLLYLGIFGTAIAFVLYFYLLRSTSAILMSLITFVTPPLALLWGWIVLNENLSAELFLGMLIIFSGILVVRRA
jgi:drug/metabolite transporter (DMT)-like permease